MSVESITSVRLPPDLRAKVAASAKEHRRSISADMVWRLHSSFQAEAAGLEELRAQIALQGRALHLATEEIERLRNRLAQLERRVAFPAESPALDMHHGHDTDIMERLREASHGWGGLLMHDAAAEIERLRAEMCLTSERWEAENERLRTELDRAKSLLQQFMKATQ